jgi:sigma-B regulation protein RsbU (phosphoserine phosphatase)
MVATAMQSQTQTQASNAGVVLVVDDEPVTRTVVRSHLTNAGYEVLVASSGQEALASLQTRRPDLIVLDQMMPQMTGVELTRELRGSPELREVPIILMTASRAEEDLEAAFAAGANDYLSKPVPKTLLLSRVESALAATQQLRSNRERDSLLKDIAEASALQQSRLPQLPLERGGWSISGAVVPCRQLGGDFVDVMSTADGSPVAAIIDVCGHGTASALMSVSITTELSMLLKTRDLEEAIRALNYLLCASATEFYACVAVIELAEKQARVINAGLPPLAVVRDGKVVQRVMASGTPPGMVPQASYDVTTLEMGEGDRLVAMTDGLTEPFGMADAVEPCLARLELAGSSRSPRSFPPRAIASEIRELFAGDAQGMADDATLVLMEKDSRR